MNYSNGRMWDEYDKAMSRITDLEEKLEKANARAEAAEAKVAALQTALQEANEDAERLASVLANGGLKRQAIALHRARVGGAS